MTPHDDSPSDTTAQAIAALTARVTELEVALTYQRENTNALDQVVRELFEQIARLERQLEALRDAPPDPHE